MIKVDIHTHSAFSQDGKSLLCDMLKVACEQGCSYYGISEHFNADYLQQLNRLLRPMDIVEYFSNARLLQKEYEEKINVLVGAEFGYSDDEKTCAYYCEIINKYQPDFIINSVHSYGGLDYTLLRKAFSKEEICKSYLSLVEKSINSPYPYDIVGHIGYPLRYVDNGNEDELVKGYKDEIIKILQLIIDKDKILEVNSSTSGLVQETLPDKGILSLYYQLGGRKVSYGSDAHDVNRIGDKREYVYKMLSDIGFSYLTIPYKGKHIKIDIK